MKPNPIIVVIGQLTLDDVVKFDQPAILDSPGGSGLYALAGVCMWDVKPLGFVTRMGNDYDLKNIFKIIGNRLDLKGIKELEEPSIHIWNMFDRKGNRYFITQRWGSYDDVMGIYPEDIPPEYYSSHSFLIAAFPFDWQSKVIESLPSHAIIAVDPHFQGVYPQYNDRWNKLLKKITVFLPSEEELIRFFNIKPSESLGEYIPYLKDLSSRGPEVICVKLGERGAIVYDRTADMTWHVPAYPVKEIVDVTGSGDVFCGGFIANYVYNKDAYTSALFGVISASFNLEQYGVLHNYSIDRQSVIDRFNEFNSKLHKSEQQLN
jgi:sugar/nucleoside kinase (ribokinase family)